MFVFLSFPTFFSLSAIAEADDRRQILKVYAAINYLNKNLTYFVWYLEKEKSYDIEALSIEGVLNKEQYYGKSMQKMCNKNQPQTLFKFW